MGLDIYLDWKGRSEVEGKAQLTGFQTRGDVGYLRSSYNDGGFNAWARRNLGGKDFYWIFDYWIFDYSDKKEVPVNGTEDETGFFPDWSACRARVETALAEAKTLDNLYTIRVSAPHDLVEDEADAMNQFRKQRGSKHGFEQFSNRLGLWNYSTEPYQVRAIFFQRGFMGGSEAVLVCEGKEPHAHYLTTLQETLAFIELGEQKNGWLIWSG